MGSLRWNGIDFFASIGALVVSASSGSSSSGSTASTTVHACAKNGNDREDVLGKLALGGRCIVCFHCDFCSMVLEYVLDEVVCKAAKAVTVGNMHDSYTPCKDLL